MMTNRKGNTVSSGNHYKVSVIVPVYKVEEYIKECVDSILQQTYLNMEIILVDDGSPDKCGQICDEYAKLDGRVKVIHKENGGLSDARNYGLDAATGEYISFIDSDDYISPVFYELLMNVFRESNADIVALKGGTDFWDEMTVPKLNCDCKKKKYKQITNKEALEMMLYHKIATGAQFKIYRKEMFEDIRFPKGYLYEDVATTYKTFIKAKNVAIVDEPLYAYRKRQESIIRQSFSEKKMICLKIADQVIADIRNYDESLVPAAISRVYSMVYSVFLQVPKEDQADMLRLWEWMKKHRSQIIRDNSSLVRKKNKYGAMISYLGKNASYYLGRKFGQKGSMKKIEHLNL